MSVGLTGGSNPFRSVSRRDTIRKWHSHLMLVLCIGAVLIALIPLLSILFEVFRQGLPALSYDLLTKRQYFQYFAGGGIANALWGSVLIVGTASLIGMPIGILAGIYLSEYGQGRPAAVVRFFADVFAEFPSIIIGLFAYGVIVVWTGHFSVFAGAFALSVMLVPIVTRTTEEALHLVPDSVREAGLALGLPRWRVTGSVVLRAAKGGLLTGSLLGFSRIFGETAPLVVTIGGSLFFAKGLDDTSSSLTYVVWRGATSGIHAAEVRAWGAATVLLLVVLAINISVRVITSRRAER